MARKEKIITISADNRDNGKKFLLTEMSAFAAENWASRAAISILNSGGDVNFKDIDPNMGMIGIVSKVYDLLKGIRAEDALSLWGELMQCVEFIPSNGEARPFLEDDLEEYTTIMMLKKEVFKLHTDFIQSVIGQISEPQEKPSAV